MLLLLFLFSIPASSEIYTLSLHDALPILVCVRALALPRYTDPRWISTGPVNVLAALSAKGTSIGFAANTFTGDRKSTRLNSSHPSISYAVFCLKKKKTKSTPYEHSSHPRL